LVSRSSEISEDGGDHRVTALRSGRCFAQTSSALLAMLGMLSCAGPKVTVETLPELTKYRIQTIVVLPFQALNTPQVSPINPTPFLVPPGAKRSDINVVAPPPERLSPELIPVPPHAAEKIAEMFHQQLQRREGLRVLSPTEASGILRSDALSEAPEELARKVTSKLSADAVLFGRVLVYRERGGSKWGGDPASVGFEIKLLAADGTTVWVGNYYETQRPMNEDLIGFFERGGVFVTAEELAEYGVTKLLKKFPLPAST
jgi:hypothetical protein